VKIFSRNLENMTVTYPDVVKAMIQNIPVTVTNCIIDSELVAFDNEKEKILPFQTMTQRSKKNVTSDDLKIKLCIYAFDLLYLNSTPLINEDFITRRAKLHSSFEPKKGQFLFASYEDATEFEQIEQFLDASVKNCCEGLMVKTLEGDKATYEPDKRSFNWLKLKKDYLDSAMGDSLDLVVVGADFGKGKRTKFFGSFVLACYDPATEKLQVCCKCGTGFSDEMLSSLFEKLEPLMIDNAPSNVTYGSKNFDVWLEPKFVWEIMCADLTLSPVYMSAQGVVETGKGIALRFPRFIREREDKRPDNATSSDQIVVAYR